MTLRSYLIAALLTLVLSLAKVACADSIVIRYFDTYPTPGVSTENVELRIERKKEFATSFNQRIDQLFGKTKGVLERIAMPEYWAVAPAIDAPIAEIKVEIDGKSWRTQTSASGGELFWSIPQTPEDRARQAAWNEVFALATTYLKLGSGSSVSSSRNKPQSTPARPDNRDTRQ